MKGLEDGGKQINAKHGLNWIPCQAHLAEALAKRARNDKNLGSMHTIFKLRGFNNWKRAI